MFETETVGPCLVQKLNWGGHDPPAPSLPPSGYASVIKCCNVGASVLLINLLFSKEIIPDVCTDMRSLFFCIIISIYQTIVPLV